jgi:hypothetical protein
MAIRHGPGESNEDSFRRKNRVRRTPTTAATPEAPAVREERERLENAAADADARLPQPLQMLFLLIRVAKL